MNSYINIVIFIIFSIILSILLFALSYIFSYKNYDYEKVSAYECGFEPFNNSKGTFNIQFFIIGILFILFDLEIIFFFPWTKNLYSLGIYGFWIGIIFFIILTIGFCYEWKKGVLNWSNNIYYT